VQEGPTPYVLVVSDNITFMVQEGPTPYVLVVSDNITFMVQEVHHTDDSNAKHYLEKERK
jgi:hypothetical protein